MSLRLLFNSVVPLAFFLVLYGCEYKPKWKDFQGGIHVVLEVESKGDSSVDEQNTLRVRDILSERMSEFGVREKVIKTNGERRIFIQLPKFEQSQRIVDLFSQSFFLQFKLVDDESSLEEALKGNMPPGREILYQTSVDPQTGGKTGIPHLLMDQTPLTGDYIADARVAINPQYNEPYISLSFDAKGAQIFEQLTGSNVGKRLAIVLDKNVYSAPVIQEKIPGGRAQITGRFSMEEAIDLAIALRSGAYPAHTRIIEKKELTNDLWMGDMD
ncbi:MAG: preprotein translocase subunit SecD [Promethearchaeota archaeon]